MTMRLIPSAALFAGFITLAGLANADTILSVLIDSNPETIAAIDALTKAYAAANPGIRFDIEQRAGGADGDNIIKTRLSTGEMADIFDHNSGSLFQALKPEQTLADLSRLPSQAGILDSFKTVVTSPDGVVRGVPFGPAMGGGIYYNKKIYADLGLTVPTTWAEFMAKTNNWLDQVSL